MKRWMLYLVNANKYETKSRSCLTTSVKLLAKEKGFNPEQCKMFDVCFATGNETVVTYNGCGEMADLDLRVMATMTRKEIVDLLSKYGADFII